KSQRKKGTKITAAVYEYQVDYDGEWGEISFDFVKRTAEVVKLAELDTIKSNIYAKLAFQLVFSLSTDTLPKKLRLPIE
ncbi:MAG: hypothetical protein LUG99_02495, partial [Lachnospiraceae bacterium]|nr:hypothetical protein [Lachnospiraceae bacterium]